eukprot:1184111-Prorocentrum_minimum.AAC.1
MPSFPAYDWSRVVCAPCESRSSAGEWTGAGRFHSDNRDVTFTRDESGNGCAGVLRARIMSSKHACTRGVTFTRREQEHQLHRGVTFARREQEHQAVMWMLSAVMWMLRAVDVDVKGCDVDVKGCAVDVKGCDVDVKGSEGPLGGSCPLASAVRYIPCAWMTA